MEGGGDGYLEVGGIQRAGKTNENIIVITLSFLKAPSPIKEHGVEEKMKKMPV